MRPPQIALQFVERHAVEGTCADFLDLYGTLASSPDCLIHFPDAAIYLLIDRCENASASLHFIAWNKAAPHFLEAATSKAIALARGRQMQAVDFAPPVGTLSRAEIEAIGFRYVLSTYEMKLQVPSPLPEPPLPPSYRFASLSSEYLRDYYEAAQAAFRDNPETRIPDFEAFSQRTLALEIKPEILFHGDTVVGFTKVLPKGEIVTIGVVPPHRGKSLGKALTYRAINILRKIGLHEVTLTVLNVNRVALSLYEQMGFVKTGEQSSYSISIN